MRSLRTKITAMTLCAIIVTMLVAGGLGMAAIRHIGTRNAEQTLLLMCETGQKNLDHYFESVAQSVEMVSAYVESDLDGLSEKQLQAHLDRVSDIFSRLTYRTYGVLTYYYRIDPAISTTAKGFWYVNLDGDGFKSHEVTDITLYDTDDTSGLVWFTVPKATGKGVWLPPYITDNLNVRVISYNVPVYFRGTFVGVIGIEIDYSTMAEEVDNITLYDSGYAFLNDAEGKIIYHPHVDVMTLAEQPRVPEGLLSQDRYTHYTYDGVEKQAVWLPLSNGMHLNVTVPVREINADWQRWRQLSLAVFVVLAVIFIAISAVFAGHITRPLRELTAAARQVEQGNYDIELNYDAEDEVGVLTRTIKQVTAHLKSYISDLNDLAYADALTALHNKGAFDLYVKDMEEELTASHQTMRFAVCIFDCNNLKKVNDTSGHDKGDIYLRETAQIICEVFDHSPVFRIGGDEFAALLQDRDYKDRDRLMQMFDEKCAEKRVEETEVWAQVSVARGMAVYDPGEDESVNDVVRRADKLMYEDKWQSKRTEAAL